MPSPCKRRSHYDDTVLVHAASVAKFCVLATGLLGACSGNCPSVTVRTQPSTQASTVVAAAALSPQDPVAGQAATSPRVIPATTGAPARSDNSADVYEEQRRQLHKLQTVHRLSQQSVHRPTAGNIQVMYALCCPNG
jgi:hypothetical protein